MINNTENYREEVKSGQDTKLPLSKGLKTQYFIVLYQLKLIKEKDIITYQTIKESLD